MYRITDWERFEHPEKSRRPKKGMPWHAHPTNLASKGATRLVRKGTEGYVALLVFERMVMLHAQRFIDQRDGRMLEADGAPMDAEDIADAILMPEQDVTPALALLCDPKIGWLSYESVPISTEPVRNTALQDRTGQDIPPNPPRGAEGSAARGGEGSKAEPGGIPDDCLDAWDANRSGRMLEARRPPDPGTVKRWERLGRPGADEIADRVRRAGSSPRYANPDRADPLTFGALMSRSTWAAVGELEVTPTARAPDMAAAQARTALGAAEHLWGLGDHETARKVLGRALDHPATAEEAAHIRDLWEREKEGVA